jgi:hypothetical protein
LSILLTAILVVLRIGKGGNHQVLNIWKETAMEEGVKTARVQAITPEHALETS